jgi:hypothetical protein
MLFRTLWLAVSLQCIWAKCDFNIPLNSQNWTVSESEHNSMIFFCNQSSPVSKCPIVPPNQTVEWLQLGSPLAGRAKLLYEFPEECFPYFGFDLEVINILTVADNKTRYQQNATLLISIESDIFYWPIGSGFNWSNGTYTATPATTKPNPMSGHHLQLILEIKDNANSQISQMTIGEILLRLF